jgi:hypothetical protein
MSCEGAPQGWSGHRRHAAGLPAPVLAILLVLILMVAAAPAQAQLHAHPDAAGRPLVRSLESLRDLDFQSWQVVAYRQGPPGGGLRLRIVGYPGRLQQEQPTPLLVSSGRFRWELENVTLSSPRLASDTRAAAAEFDLAPLLADLRQNRPLRLALPGVFAELPVPPYVVEEWRRLPEWQDEGPAG